MASAMCACFEIGRAYELRDGAPVEMRVLTLGATGLAREKAFTNRRANTVSRISKAISTKSANWRADSRGRRAARAGWRARARRGSL